ncbi:flagellar protein FliT [Vibrio astriarenae]|uniref:Flagellar protein FliT n=1 Tax=Vibrio astriarenae TaxID=1481923 RepID=A0A7Z2T1U4_9VIBR|nr:flagellar protein FliT [Vibrio astriarenae]QIA62796.1 flagellar protein FliT [Vibrio astriarenae]
MNRYQAIYDIDHKIAALMESEQFNSQEFRSLVDTRKRMIENALSEIERQPTLAQEAEWLDLVSKTKKLIAQMEQQTRATGEELRKFRKGVKSVQQYKRFI